MASTHDRPGALGVGRCASGSSDTSGPRYVGAGVLIHGRRHTGVSRHASTKFLVRIGRERDGHITQAGDIHRHSIISGRVVARRRRAIAIHANIASRRDDQPGAHIFVILSGNVETNPVATHVGERSSPSCHGNDKTHFNTRERGLRSASSRNGCRYGAPREFGVGAQRRSSHRRSETNISFFDGREATRRTDRCRGTDANDRYGTETDAATHIHTDGATGATCAARFTATGGESAPTPHGDGLTRHRKLWRRRSHVSLLISPNAAAARRVTVCSTCANTGRDGVHVNRADSSLCTNTGYDGIHIRRRLRRTDCSLCIARTICAAAAAPVRSHIGSRAGTRATAPNASALCRTNASRAVPDTRTRCGDSLSSTVTQHRIDLVDPRISSHRRHLRAGALAAGSVRTATRTAAVHDGRGAEPHEHRSQLIDFWLIRSRLWSGGFDAKHSAGHASTGLAVGHTGVGVDLDHRLTRHRKLRRRRSRISLLVGPNAVVSRRVAGGIRTRNSRRSSSHLPAHGPRLHFAQPGRGALSLRSPTLEGRDRIRTLLPR
jgi:hypothetical protein